MSTEPQCPFSGDTRAQSRPRHRGNADWWPNQLNLGLLHQHSPRANPMGAVAACWTTRVFATASAAPRWT